MPHHTDGVFVAYSTAGTDEFHRTWRLVQRQGDGRWERLAEGPAGRGPVNLVASPDGRLLVIGWPDGRPRIWSGRPADGRVRMEEEAIPRPWITSDWSYNAAGISSAGDVAVVQSDGGVPGGFVWGCRAGNAARWINGSTPVKERHCYS